MSLGGSVHWEEKPCALTDNKFIFMTYQAQQNTHRVCVVRINVTSKVIISGVDANSRNSARQRYGFDPFGNLGHGRKQEVLRRDEADPPLIWTHRKDLIQKQHNKTGVLPNHTIKTIPGHTGEHI